MYLVMIGMDKDIEQITKLLLSLKDNANSFSQDVAVEGLRWRDYKKIYHVRY